MDEKNNFQTLVDYIKYVISLTMIWLGLISGIFVFFLWSDRKDMKESIEKIESEAIADIQKTKSLAGTEIQQIKEEVRYQTRREIDEVFRTNTITLLLEDKTATEINRNAAQIINKEISKEAKRVQEELNELILISDAASQMRGYEYKGMSKLQYLSRYAKSQNNRILSTNLLRSICTDIMRKFGNHEFSYDKNTYSSNKDYIKNYPVEIMAKHFKEVKEKELLELNMLIAEVNGLNQTFGTNFSICELDEIITYLENL